VADQRRGQALELYLAGATPEVIAQTLGYASGDEAREVIQGAFGVGAVAAELARLDALLTGLWANARRGDVQAVDRVLRIGERRLALLALAQRTSLAESVAEGRRSGLEALRDVLAGTIAEVEPTSRAPLARQLTIVMEQLDNLPGGQEVNPVDDLERKRAERRAAASGQ
jgi:hypothetical protein